MEGPDGYRDVWRTPELVSAWRRGQGEFGSLDLNTATSDSPAVFAGLLTVIVIGHVVETLPPKPRDAVHRQSSAVRNPDPWDGLSSSRYPS